MVLYEYGVGFSEHLLSDASSSSSSSAADRPTWFSGFKLYALHADAAASPGFKFYGLEFYDLHVAAAARRQLEFCEDHSPTSTMLSLFFFAVLGAACLYSCALLGAPAIYSQ